MKNKIRNRVLGILAMASLIASTGVVSSAFADTLADQYFSKEKVTLSQTESEALAIAKQWSKESNTGLKPIPGKNGAVQFVYGAQTPTIICAVLQITDIALQPGETVNNVQLGDSARWNVEPAISGTDAAPIEHLVVKPLDVGLETSLVVTTDKRTYHIKLKSTRSEYLPLVSFIYPQSASEKWAKWQAKAKEIKQSREEKTLPKAEGGAYLGDLDFNYTLDGDARWKPVRVYNDGNKTIIQMPKAMGNTEAPTLLVIREGSSEDQNVMVNYRIVGDRYIVDNVFDKAILIAGVGRNQEKVVINKNG